jgi:putative salt-induced outer membrane protein
MARRFISGLLGVALCVTSGTALAQWTGKAEIGASFASGNSENESANAAAEVKYARDKWGHTLGFAGNYGSDSGARRPSAGNCAASPTTSSRTARTGSAPAATRTTASAPTTFQASLATGLGYKLIDEERTKLWVQGGPGYRYAEFRETGESEDGLIFRGDLGFEHQLTDTTKIVDRFLIETGSDNTYIQNDLGLEVTINGALGLRVGYQIRHNTDVTPGLEKTDTLTTLGLIYETK